MKELIYISCLGFLIVSCDPSGIKKTAKEDDPVQHDTAGTDTVATVSALDADLEVVDEKKLKGGLKIKWKQHGTGDLLKDGEMIDIEYKVSLDNGEVVEGTHMMPDSVVPFIIGFGMQTEGWDIALREMKVGDNVELFIPSKLARGNKSIEGLIPENSDIVVRLRVADKRKPDREIDGNKVWIFRENKKNDVLFDENKEIDFHVMAFTKSNPVYINTFRNGTPFKMKLEDQGLVPGLKKALINAKKDDHMFILVPSSEAYKNKGYQDLVKPNEDIMYNVLVMDVHDK